MKAARKGIKAGYDAAGYDPDLQRHWAVATGMSADATADSHTRRQLRNRARYEVLENNSYGRGIVSTLVEDTIGTGPRLQLHLPSDANNTAVEKEFWYWACAIRLPQKLRTMKTSKTVDGEAVGKLVTNPPISHDVKLDLQLIEADRLCSPIMGWDTETYIDGIHLDEFGNPEAYDILDVHPGSNLALSLFEYTTFARDQIIHFYRHDRPEQHRGVSEVTAALPLFAHLRDFTLSTVTAARTAAAHAMVLETNTPAPDPLDEELTWETIPLERNVATVLPAEMKLGQVTPEHPSTNYEMFKKQIINEIARCLCMPYNIAAADSSGYNYASGRLDHQVYDRALRVEQSNFEREVLDRLLGQWLLEASLLGILPATIASQALDLAEQYGPDGAAQRLPHSWQWDRRAHVDPSKEAGAQRMRLQSGTTSREYELREQGLDIDEVDAQAASGFGITVEQYRQALAASILTNGNPGGFSDDAGGVAETETGGEDSAGEDNAEATTPETEGE